MNRQLRTSLIMLLCQAIVAHTVLAQPPTRPTESVEAAIHQHAVLPNIQPYTGQPVGDHANRSGGNKTDGPGYFMTGAKPNSFFYYVFRTRRVYANWGPIRDKYAQAGYEFGPLGWPSDDEYLLPDGSGFFQRFDHAWIYYYLYDKVAGKYTVLSELKNPNLNPSRPH
jgi:hypothetical protein